MIYHVFTIKIEKLRYNRLKGGMIMHKSFNQKIVKKTIATMLVFVMVFSFMPNIVVAFNTNTISEIISDMNTSETLEKHLRKESEKAKTKEPVIVGELETERTLIEKHFIMSDGSIMASIFPSNIHYEKDGKFFDVDNTLEEIMDTKETLKRKIEESVKQDEKINTIENEEIPTQEEKNEIVTDMLENIEEITGENRNQELNNEDLQKNNADETTEQIENVKKQVEITTKHPIQEFEMDIEQKENNSSEMGEKQDIIEEQKSQKQIPKNETQQISKEQSLKIAKEQAKETKVYTNKTGNAKINFTNKTYGYNLGSIESEEHIITWGLQNSL